MDNIFLFLKSQKRHFYGSKQSSTKIQPVWPIFYGILWNIILLCVFQSLTM